VGSRVGAGYDAAKLAVQLNAEADLDLLRLAGQPPEAVQDLGRSGGHGSQRRPQRLLGGLELVPQADWAAAVPARCLDCDGGPVVQGESDDVVHGRPSHLLPLAEQA
jgi:hypothetical protein